MAEKNTEMRAYTKYSFFMERSLGLGRNGKRLAHGGLAAAGTWAAGHYGGVEIINQNMPQAIVAGGVAGVGLTVLADMALIDDHEQALMDLESLRLAEQSNPALTDLDEQLRKNKEAIQEDASRVSVIGGKR